MSTLAELTGAAATSSDVLPGHVLSPWTLAEIADAEQAFEKQHLQTMIAGSEKSLPSVRAEVIDQAQMAIACGMFSWGSPGWWLNVASGKHLAYTLYLSLRAKQPPITPAAAATLITPDNRDAIREAVRKAAGWKPAPNLQAGGTAQNSATSSPSPGGSSLETSPPATSPPNMPAA